MQEEVKDGIAPFEAESSPSNVLNADGSLFDPTIFDPTELSEPKNTEPVVVQEQPSNEDQSKYEEQPIQAAQGASEADNQGEKLGLSQNQRLETEKTIYVSNLDHSVRYNDLKRYFSNFGEIDRIRDRKQNDGKYFAFVLYKNVESVNKALMEANGKPSIRQAGPTSANQGSIKGQTGNDKSDKESSYSESDYKNQKDPQMRSAIEDRISLREGRDRSDLKDRRRENGDRSEHKDKRSRRRSSDEKSRSRSRDRKKRDRRRSNRNSSSRNSSKSSKSESRRDKARKSGRDRDNSSHNAGKDRLSNRKDKASTSRSRDVSREARKRSRDRDRTRDRETDRDREKQREKDKDIEREREREKERQREKEKIREREKAKRPSSFNEYKEEYDARSFHKMILSGKLKYPSGICIFD